MNDIYIGDPIKEIVAGYFLLKICIYLAVALMPCIIYLQKDFEEYSRAGLEHLQQFLGNHLINQ